MKNTEKYIDVLGVRYEIIWATDREQEKLKECDGYVETQTKKIVVEKAKKSLMSLDNLDSYMRKVLRHEIVHAFLYESGLDKNSDWARKEEVVDWVAIQSEKLWKAMKEADAL